MALQPRSSAAELKAMVEAMYDADATKTICVVRKTVMVVKDGIRFDPKKFYTAVGVRP